MAETNNNQNNPPQQPSSRVQKRRNSGSSTKLADFAEFRQIGRGAFGQVFRAIYKKLDREFALKKISKREIQNQYMASQLSNQIKISKSLKHDNIIKLYDTFEENQHFYLVLELAHGGQLYSKLMKKGRFSEDQTKIYIRDVVSAVKYLHSRDPAIIHRDIKPENILLDQNGKVKLADFGWSNFSNKPRKTYCGTVHYLAPEMIDKSGHDGRLDIWCMGVLVYELLTGKTPFIPLKDMKNEGALKKQIQENILNVRMQFPEDFPTQAKSFVLGMVKRNPKERMTIDEIEKHPWLQQEIQQIIPPLPSTESIIRRPSTVTTIPQEQDNRYAEEMKKKINDLEKELNEVKASPGRVQNQNLDSNTERAAILKELRDLKVTREMNETYRKENDQLMADLKSRDKKIIELKHKLLKSDELEQDLERAQSEKKHFQQKIRKLQKDLQQSKSNEKKLKQDLTAKSDSIPNKLKSGAKIKLREMNNNEFIFYLQQQLEMISDQFEQNKKILNKVMERQKVNEEKENQLVKLRVEQKNIHEEIRAELKEQYETDKDNIVLSLRNQLTEEREKWLEDYLELKNMYDGNARSLPEDSKVSDRENDLVFEVKNLKEVNSNYEKTMKNMESQIKDLEETIKRKK